MKGRAGKILFLDKPLLAISFATAVAVIAVVVSAVAARNYESSNNSLKDQLTEIRNMSGEIALTKALVESGEKKISLNKSAGVVSALENILKSINLRARVLKPMGKTKAGEFSEENAQMEIEGADLNSIVNLLYRIDTAPSPLKIKSAAFRSTFDDPEKFVVTLTVALMSRG